MATFSNDHVSHTSLRGIAFLFIFNGSKLSYIPKNLLNYKTDHSTHKKSLREERIEEIKVFIVYTFICTAF